MAPVAGASIIVVASSVLLGSWFGLRGRVASIWLDVISAVCGAAVMVGGLLCLDDVGAASWFVGPPALAAMAVAHRRALFAGDGPLRT